MDKLASSISVSNHKGGLNISKVIDTLNKSTYEGKKVSITAKVATIAEKNLKIISEKVSSSDGTNLTSIQATIQSTVNKTISNIKSSSSGSSGSGSGSGSGSLDTTSPIFTSLSQVQVYEKQTNAITLQATDTNTITYSISGVDANIFNINSSSGVITFKVAPKYIDKTAYSFIATAKDIAGNATTQNISIIMRKIDTTSPVFSSSNTISVKENQTDALIVQASDVNTINYTVSGTDSDSFDIDIASGKVVFKEAPDYEVKTSYTFLVTAKDIAGNEASQTITITILDIDDANPIFDNIDYNITVSENQRDVMTLKATDENTITFSISGGDSDKFNISDSGIVVFKVAPDYETKKVYTFIAKAEDSLGNIATKNITINISDIDESVPDNDAPIFQISNAIDVNENTINVMILKATDINAITYSISGVDSSSLIVNGDSGVIVFKTAPDYESGKTTYEFIATAKDVKNNVANQNVTISIKDVDEILPVWTSANEVSVNENQSNAITLQATDLNIITYSISGGDSSSFNIDSASGVITFKSPPDFETKAKYLFTATATDVANNKITQNVIINILYVIPLLLYGHHQIQQQ